ncbi:MAG: hypothetical protein UZ16_OP3001000765 [Candidatus Hinthialibacteria bacterium OLB16]|nr:MAG: hypothetical protein UZ16_OP3001000765 [Candidatus Hinthialibacteria bacterium OLB16]
MRTGSKGPAPGSFWLETVFALEIDIGEAGLHDGVHVVAADAAAGHHGGHFLFLAHLPVDEVLDVRVVDIDDHHFGGPACGATGFDRSGGTVADAQEAHQSRASPAAGQRFADPADVRKIRACS